MRLPQFNAEASLHRTMTRYINSSFSSGRHGTGSVIAQVAHPFCPPTCSFSCSPPGCERTGDCQICRCECPPSFR
jgi:hypothetical protein